MANLLKNPYNQDIGVYFSHRDAVKPKIVKNRHAGELAL